MEGSRLSRAFGSNSFNQAKAGSENFDLSTRDPCSLEGRAILFRVRFARRSLDLQRGGVARVGVWSLRGLKAFCKILGIARAGWIAIGAGIEAGRQRRWATGAGGACGGAVARFATAGDHLVWRALIRERSSETLTTPRWLLRFKPQPIAF